MSHSPDVTFGDQATIDSRANTLVSDWISLPHWHRRPRGNLDVFIDYDVEIVRNRQLSGLIFMAQQKAHAKVPLRKGCAIERLKTKHLRYFQEKLKWPVFLFVVDVSRGTGHFLFIQEWLDKNVPAAQLHRSKTIALEVPETNDLRNLSSLERAVEEAILYMGEKFPGSIGAAARKEAKRLSDLDPRFDVQLDYIDGHKVTKISAKGPVAIQLSLPKKLDQLMTSHIEWGRAVSIESQQFEFSGSELFRELFPKGEPLTIATEHARIEAEIRLKYRSGGKHHWLPVKGHLTRGASGLEFSSSGASLPFKLRNTFPTMPPGKGGSGEFVVQWDLHSWYGKPILSLSDFAPVFALAKVMVNGGRVALELAVGGISGPSGSTNGKPTELGCWNTIEAFGDFRETAKLLEINPTFPEPDPIPESVRLSWFRSSELIRTGRFCDDFSEKTFELHIPVELLRADVSAAVDAKEIHDIHLTQENQQFRFLDHQITLPKVRTSFSRVKVILDEATRAQLKTGPCDVRLKIQGVAGSRRLLERASPVANTRTEIAANLLAPDGW